MSDTPSALPIAADRGTAGEVFRAFLRLGISAFGGPVAHLGYFRTEFVIRRRWIDEDSYADLLALCHFLPGPASSQLGFLLGVQRAGLSGGIAAWLGFTLPSALLMVLFAFSVTGLHGPVASGLLHGLKLTAVAVVAQAVWGMAHNLAPDRPRAAIALAAMVLSLVGGAFSLPLIAILVGGLLGIMMRLSPGLPSATLGRLPVRPGGGIFALILFALIFAATWLPQSGQTRLALFGLFYHAGALVFGGGHVVLPLLQKTLVLPGWIGNQAFLAGYGFAQAVPGPLFTFAAYLGAVIAPGGARLAGAAIALIGIFLPGLLLVYGVLPFWEGLRRHNSTRAAMAGANAAVVGILGAALYTPVWTSAVLSPADAACAAAGFMALVRWRMPPWTLVLLLPLVGAVEGGWSHL
ncbi:chromate efflux transporter [Acidisoma silvae]|uniref:Chromate efflux transporter n=1 Tax=Acidisoma silvae TaxID=2802396 RepID=A0A963YPP1_9PROT|nr:chromate efflux transporter [Acidisoma silvae]MCB8873965.1 chromate efflux transporter [Acidisoma silvae]